jgi:hypothetical protein
MSKFGYIGANKAPSQTELDNDGLLSLSEHADLVQPNDGSIGAAGFIVEYVVVGGGGNGSHGGGGGGGVENSSFVAKTGVEYTVTVGGTGGTSSIVGDGRTVVSVDGGGNAGS